MVKLPNLAMARLSAGLSQEELANKSRVSRTSISAIERGFQKAKAPVCAKLARALGLKVWQLVSDDPKVLDNEPQILEEANVNG